jgi:hypothetical protein
MLRIIRELSLTLENVPLLPEPLIELGYALNALGEHKIIMVMNKAYGGPELLPFDLRARRTITYFVSPETGDRSVARKSLEKDLTRALRAIFYERANAMPGEIIKPLSLAEQARVAIEGNRPDQSSLVRKYMQDLAATIVTFTPIFTQENRDRWDILFDQALSQSVESVVTFTQLATYIAEMNAGEAARAMYKGFEYILNLYTFPHTGTAIGSYFQIVHDVAKFLGHELFVTFAACFIREERWDLIGSLLREQIYSRKADFEISTTLPFHYMNSYVVLLVDRKNRLNSGRLSIHDDILAQRHSEGEIASIMPLTQFADADYFLFLSAQVDPEETPESIVWAPWSLLSLNAAPRYLNEAQYKRGAQFLAQALSLGDIDILRERLTERAHILSTAYPSRGFSWHYGMERFDFSTIGAK